MNILESRNLTEKSALDSLLATCNTNSNLSGGDTITEINQHTTDANKFWVIEDDLTNQYYATPSGATANQAAINNAVSLGDVHRLNKTRKQLEDDGYLEKTDDI